MQRDWAQLPHLRPPGRGGHVGGPDQRGAAGVAARLLGAGDLVGRVSSGSQGRLGDLPTYIYIPI